MHVGTSLQIQIQRSFPFSLVLRPATGFRELLTLVDLDLKHPRALGLEKSTFGDMVPTVNLVSTIAQTHRVRKDHEGEEDVEGQPGLILHVDRGRVTRRRSKAEAGARSRVSARNERRQMVTS